MRYPNAAKGIKKIFLAEILSIIAAALCVGVLVLLAVSHVNLNESGDVLRDKLKASGMSTPFLIYSLGTLVLFLFSYILNMAGITQAAHDEESFRRALWAAVAGLLVILAGSFLNQNNPQISKWIEILNTVCTMVMTLLVLSGIGKIADSLGKTAVSELSRNTSRIVLYPFLMSVAGELLIAVLSLNETASALCQAAVYLMDIVAYVCYLRVLMKARTMQ